ncbi:zf-TFIIB domain-containing protein [Sphaerisporangium sp. TRM90804]|uniref:TFIIB-type zinc ribbon-containing protein n=1 Tax=Sphaerisporangium sp. TRM90804 TaxID=3031113 RepID=UPI00244C9B3B|nr:zf-TFIIB domain-containing protein [Sphaerisporangium sp. TRM90804]MDH2429613.1 zf-TFIIB domain-containing protein [Sphaerisporangium sp. TRM90804]
MHCPKCHGSMRTFNRSGVQLEQCDNCRGIFLDYGELEQLSRMESQYAQQQYSAPPPPPGGPAWGAPHHGGHHRGHKRGWAGMLFSS